MMVMQTILSVLRVNLISALPYANIQQQLLSRQPPALSLGSCISTAASRVPWRHSHSGSRLPSAADGLGVAPYRGPRLSASFHRMVLA
jgi:hypothetical protein